MTSPEVGPLKKESPLDERVLDTGIVVVGDISITLLDIELLTLRLRLFISSAQTAREMGLDWWTGDPFFSVGARRLEDENRDLRERLARLEQQNLERGAVTVGHSMAGHGAPGDRSPDGGGPGRRVANEDRNTT